MEITRNELCSKTKPPVPQKLPRETIRNRRTLRELNSLMLVHSEKLIQTVLIRTVPLVQVMSHSFIPACAVDCTVQCTVSNVLYEHSLLCQSDSATNCLRTPYVQYVRYISTVYCTMRWIGEIHISHIDNYDQERNYTA